MIKVIKQALWVKQLALRLQWEPENNPRTTQRELAFAV